MQTLRTDVMIDLLSAPASGLLYVRGLAINGCEAIRDGAHDSGTVLFDVDRRRRRSQTASDGRALRQRDVARY